MDHITPFPASSTRGSSSHPNTIIHPTHPNPHLARLAIPYSASLPSLRKQAQDPMSPGQPVSPIRGPTPADLQSHLYQSFLTRKTADVALRIRGSWSAVYRLHRVILIQAGFFQSLFTSGFAESNRKPPSSRRSEPDAIDIVLDDPNITRAAFEVCIARLYGGGPPLHVSPSLIPTPSQPLTPAFPSPSSAPPLTPPAGHQSASPRFLLSLLATAVFLSMPAVAAEALQMILNTVGPHTAVRYLNFAIGRGIGLADGDEGGDGHEAAVGLDSVAEIVEEVDEKEAERAERKREKAEEKERESLTKKMGALDVSSDTAEHPSPSSQESSSTPRHDHPILKEGPASVTSDDTESDMDLGTDDYDTEDRPALEPAYIYGAVSNKVGEAAACWLARWGIDILAYEQGAVQEPAADGDAAGKQKTPHVQWEPAVRGHVRSRSEEQSGARKRTSTAPSRFADPARNGVGVGASASGSGWVKEREETRDVAIPVVWRCGGLNARWVRGLLSSDALFVRGERARYDMAKTVVEMRRQEGIDDEEEREWEELFRTGIYYENMVLDDLMAISRDVSPVTGQHYVPVSVLQSAHWNQDVLRHRITARPSSSGPSPPLSPTQPHKELGLSVPTAEVAALPESEKDTLFYPVPTDSSMRIGDTTGIEGASMDQLFDLTSPTTLDASKRGVPSSEANFFGLQQQRWPASAITSSSAQGGAAKWTRHPPFRFAVEFWDVDALKEKSRLHSHTVWYAGSLYNVYVQVVRKKGVQLGVYLHRQSSVDPLPASSAPSCTPVRSPGQTHGQTHGQTQSPSTQNRPSSASVSIPRPSSLHSPSQGYSSSGLPMLPLSRSTTPVSSPNSPALAASLPSGLASSLSNSSSSSTLASSNTLPATAQAVSPQQPYRDQRAAVSAYFAIACASATGASLTRFTSAPDVFSVSQSWGWKSSSLRTEEYLEVGPDGQPRSGQSNVFMGREVSLRATVLLGVV